jgi:hypothetical protein
MQSGLPLWRRRVFYTAFLTATILGFVSYLPTMTAAFAEGLSMSVLGYSLVYLVSLGLVLIPGIPFFWRMTVGLAIIYLGGVVNLNLAGLLGSGRIWLFIFSVLTCPGVG